MHWGIGGIVRLLDKIVVLLFISIVLIFLYINNESIKVKKKGQKIQDVMIVAHSDDESLWGGSHLINGDYLVVCVTCGSDKIREKEFVRAMRSINTDYIVLDYPDLTNGKKDDWKTSYDNIKMDLKKILDYKKYNKVITHNPDGEYGHIHHQMTSEIVSDLVNHEKLYFFDKYYTLDDINNCNYGIKKIDNADYAKKQKLLSVYESQKAIIEHHSVTTMYENFISYKDWDF